MPPIFHFSFHFDSSSIRKLVNAAPLSERNFFALSLSSGSSSETDTQATPLSAYLPCSATRPGNSFLHGTHHVAHRSTTTILPFLRWISASASANLTTWSLASTLAAAGTTGVGAAFFAYSMEQPSAC